MDNLKRVRSLKYKIPKMALAPSRTRTKTHDNKKHLKIIETGIFFNNVIINYHDLIIFYATDRESIQCLGFGGQSHRPVPSMFF
ncbi:MAG: hypothetical protein HQK61_00110 [Desulfamplus sp.]|nr:hypothetical protein [Desulfamplus sp.]